MKALRAALQQTLAGPPPLGRSAPPCQSFPRKSRCILH